MIRCRRPFALSLLGAALLATSAAAQDGWTPLREAGEAASQERQEATPTIQTFDIQDLLGDTKDRQAALDRLMADVIERMEPPCREGQTMLEGVNGMLVLVGTPAQQQWLYDYLTLLRQHQELLQIESLIFTLSTGAMQEAGLRETSTLLETPAAVQEFRDALERAKNVELLVAPQLLVEPRSDASISVVNPLAYVKEWKIVTVQPGDVVVADPVIERIQEGVILEVRAHPVGATTYTLAIKLHQTEVERPIRTLTSRLPGYGQELTFALPVVTSRELTSNLTVPAGGGAVFTAPAKDGKVTGVLLRLRTLDIPREAVHEATQEKKMGGRDR